MKSAIDTLKTKIACDFNPILPDKEAQLMEKYDVADVTYFTASGLSHVGAHAADLKRLKASAEARLDNEEQVFPPERLRMLSEEHQICKLFATSTTFM